MSRANISRYLSDKITESFQENLKQPRREEYKDFTTPKRSDGDEEIYGSIGNLPAATEKLEGAPIQYDTIKEMYFTTVVNKTYSVGYEETWEAVEDDGKHGYEKILAKAKSAITPKSLIVTRETAVAAVIDGVFANAGADGVAYAASNHPLDTTKTAKVNNNLMTAGAITFDNVIKGCNMFNEIRDYAGNLMTNTEATTILANKDRQDVVNALLTSNLKPFETSNTKNTVPMLKAKFGRYINKWYWHLLDENIESFIFQRRTNPMPISEQDKIRTLNFYYAQVERYRAAQINPGFGHVSNPYTGS